MIRTSTKSNFDDIETKKSSLDMRRFSLIELLVVISIIAILMTMLLPALRSARERSKSIVCMGSLKQFGAAHAMYIGDNDGFLATGIKNCTQGTIYDNWPSKLYLYIEKDKNIRYPDRKNSVWFCPSDERTSFQTDPSWGICSDGAMADTGTVTGVPTAHKLSSCKAPSGKAYLAGNKRHHSIMREFVQIKDGSEGKLQLRHNHKTGVLFLDGHAGIYGAPPLQQIQIGNVPTDLLRRWFDVDYDSIPDL